MESSGCTTQPIAINPPHDTPLYPPLQHRVTPDPTAFASADLHRLPGCYTQPF